MEYCLRLGNGFGNKLFVLVYYLYKYPEDTIYVADQLSIHQKGTKEEKIYYMYPDLLNHPKLKFVTFKKYLELKESGMEKLNADYKVALYDVSGFSKLSVRKYFKPTQDLDYLKNKYDLDHGMFIHFRLGDKFFINLNSLSLKGNISHVIMKPDYYLKYLDSFNGSIYIFSDSIQITKCLFPDDPRFHYVDEGVNETVYCFQNCKNAIIPDSTLSISALKLNNRKYNAVVCGYYISDNVMKPASYFTESDRITVEKDKSLLMTKKQEYVAVIDRCKINPVSFRELNDLYKKVHSINTIE